ncbi:GntR family transcriptional regulator [Rathayibacter sp. AY1A3]|uniref:GntR family transcriptional regulator n=1 Tax=Rathayibacter sp. AY1A3 TaxID=2080521 RepID=UPI000CE82CD3|nr:GntR family transcriptional regulator [Rathayibacter sp. AY1A3]PPF29431.1 hypothetical protein C5C10_16435 [Rathayibacter sp. AY1A3]
MTTDNRRVLAGVLRFVRDAAAAGATLRGEVEIAETLGVSRKQVRDVLASLEQQGIVLRRQGAATEVDPVATRLSVRFEDQLEYSLLLQQHGYDSSVEVLEVSTVALPKPSADLLRTPAEQPAARIVKRWRADGEVAMLSFGTMPLPYPRADVDLGDSIYSAVKQMWGEAIAWEVTTPSAEVLGEAESELFEHPAGTAVLTLDIVGIGLSGRRLFHARELHHPGLVSYSIMRTVRPPQVFSTARYQF